MRMSFASPRASAFPSLMIGRLPHLTFSRIAQCSLTLRPARLAGPQKGPFLEVLQLIRYLLSRLECFQPERQLAGPDLHRGGGYGFPRRT
jgi:hypothetical protein